MSQRSVQSQRNSSWNSTSPMTYDCPICMTTNTRQLIQLPCSHNLCLSCLYMICAHSTLSCPFCRRRLSTWLRHNPDYSKLIIKREMNSDEGKQLLKKMKKKKKKTTTTKQPKPKYQPKRRYNTSKPKPTIDDEGHISEDWLLARQIHYEELEEFRYNYGRVTRSMAQKVRTRA